MEETEACSSSVIVGANVVVASAVMEGVNRVSEARGVFESPSGGCEGIGVSGIDEEVARTCSGSGSMFVAMVLLWPRTVVV